MQGFCSYLRGQVVTLSAKGNAFIIFWAVIGVSECEGGSRVNCSVFTELF